MSAVDILSHSGHEYVVESIFSHLDWRSILAASATCTFLNDLVVSSSALQLQLRTAYHGINRRSVAVQRGGTASQRLARMIESERNWSTLQPRHIDVLDFPDLQCWAVTDGLLLVTHMVAAEDPGDNDDDDNDMEFPKHFTSWTVHDINGRKGQGAIPKVTYQLDFEASSIASSRADNVVAVVEVSTRFDNANYIVTSVVHYFYLEPPSAVFDGSTVKAVPLADEGTGKPKTLEFNTYIETRPFQEDIVMVARLMDCELQLLPGGVLETAVGGNDMETIVWDWRTGERTMALGYTNEVRATWPLSHSETLVFGNNDGRFPNEPNWTDPAMRVAIYERTGDDDDEVQPSSTAFSLVEYPVLDENFEAITDVFNCAYDCDDPDSRLLVLRPSFELSSFDPAFPGEQRVASVAHEHHIMTLRLSDLRHHFASEEAPLDPESSVDWAYFTDYDCWGEAATSCTTVGEKSIMVVRRDDDPDGNTSRYHIHLADWRSHAARGLHPSPLGSRAPPPSVEQHQGVPVQSQPQAAQLAQRSVGMSSPWDWSRTGIPRWPPLARDCLQPGAQGQALEEVGTRPGVAAELGVEVGEAGDGIYDALADSQNLYLAFDMEQAEEMTRIMILSF